LAHGPVETLRTAAEYVLAADELDATGRPFDAIELLTQANRRQPDAALEARLARLRNTAWHSLDRVPGHADWPPSTTGRASRGHGIPELTNAELTADALREHVLTRGCVIVRDLIGPEQVALLVAGIDRALEEWGALKRPFARATGSPWFDPLPLDDDARAQLGRTWVTNSAGLLTADSPRLLFALLDLFTSLGLHDVAADYLGERPVLSANKCTLRRVPVDTNAGWHQDGAFLGRDIRAMNVWLSLSHCGIDAPSLDIVPRRFDAIVPTGTHGSYFDWAVGPELVEELTRERPVVRPVFGPGDALVFDDMLLHRTATDPAMTSPRYAIETWLFAPSNYPEGHVPIVW
jgi:hypothetical protein